MATQPSAAPEEPWTPEYTHPLGPLAESLSLGAKIIRNRGSVNPMGRRFLRALAAGLWMDPTAAARAAGYSKPVENGRRLLEKYAKIIERDKLSLFAVQKMTAEECQCLLSACGRGVIAANAQQVKALELMLRVHGLLTDKVDVNLEQSDLERAMTRAVEGFVSRQESLQTQLPPTPLRLSEPVG